LGQDMKRSEDARKDLIRREQEVSLLYEQVDTQTYSAYLFIILSCLEIESAGGYKRYGGRTTQ
jgi:hypothetical protein